ncbi:MAG: indole-3-glycerol-phosphate synthase [Desulfovibrionaceae bacterium]|nr:indole-3-glycerol-phosphate synthase [Desulfovibrionaceae bacterium]
MLERFRRAKAPEIASLEKLAAAGKMPPPLSDPRPPFIESLTARSSPLAVIAEYKRASPSEGDINTGLTPEEAAAAYAEGGAGAISVLTESEHFKGNIAYLERMTTPGLPLLRKDFIFHPLQVDESAATPASAVLLIVRLLNDASLRALLRRCENFALAPVVEVFDEQDLKRAKDAGARIIQVNNRDLESMRVDAAVSLRLAAGKGPGEFWISASGVRERGDLMKAAALGFDAALVGTALMRSASPGAALVALLGKDLPHA